MRELFMKRKSREQIIFFLHSFDFILFLAGIVPELAKNLRLFVPKQLIYLYRLSYDFVTFFFFFFF